MNKIDNKYGMGFYYRNVYTYPTIKLLKTLTSKQLLQTLFHG